ncbi:MAG: type VI secretion system tube protein Hcp [Acidobacteriia bacterium]|nr:type VI secretion system tube protein Hcp [Terriglobia bacterium]
MAFDAFLKIDGVPGESTDDKHKDWIEVLSFSHGLSQPSSATASSAGGGTTERVNVSDFSVVKHLDKSTPKLHELCCGGKHIANVTLELCRAGGDKQKYLEVKMEQVIISGVQPGGAAGGTDTLPTEHVSFNFGKIKWTYTQQKRSDGTGGGNVTGGWDLTTNKVYA